MNSPIRHIRKLLTPPCSTCKRCASSYFDASQYCYSKKYLDYVERVSGMRYRNSDCSNVRGTRFCTYERREYDE